MLQYEYWGRPMTADDEVLERASKILEKFHIGEIFVELVNQRFRFESTQSVEFVKDITDVNVNDDIKNGVVLVLNGHEIILGFSDFRASAAPDISTFYADAYVYFDKELVLHTGASKDYERYGDTTSVMTHASLLKAFKAGPWLELLEKCRDELVDDHNQREEKKRQAEVAKQASNIDLGDYE